MTPTEGKERKMSERLMQWKTLVAMAAVWIFMAVVPESAIKQMSLTDRLFTVGALIVTAIQSWRWAR